MIREKRLIHSLTDSLTNHDISGTIKSTDLKFGRRTVLKFVMSRRKPLSAFDQVSEFDRGRIVAYRDCGLSFKEIGSRVG
ncbi:UNVERIFIED_CONTAM: hypothetical protein NCL1_11490 [Trichonephila clavipes]